MAVECQKQDIGKSIDDWSVDEIVTQLDRSSMYWTSASAFAEIRYYALKPLSCRQRGPHYQEPPSALFGDVAVR